MEHILTELLKRLVLKAYFLDLRVIEVDCWYLERWAVEADGASNVLCEAGSVDEQLSASGRVLREEALLQRSSAGWKQARHREDQAQNWAAAMS